MTTWHNISSAGAADPAGAWLPRPAGAAGAPVWTGREAVPLVVDTNCVLDLWLFADPRVAALERWIRAGRARWIATAAMREELERVLSYAAIVRQMQARQLTAADVLEAFDHWSETVAPAPASRLRCSDPDDQMFIDLAIQWRAGLCSRDRAVLALAKRLQPAGVGCVPPGFVGPGAGIVARSGENR